MNIGISAATPDDLSTLSVVVKNEVFKNTKYDELVKKVNYFNTTDFIYLVKEAAYDKKS